VYVQYGALVSSLYGRVYGYVSLEIHRMLELSNQNVSMVPLQVDSELRVKSESADKMWYHHQNSAYTKSDTRIYMSVVE